VIKDNYEPPPAVPLQVDPPEVMHVIAGSVFSLSVPTLTDPDTIVGVLTLDPTWHYELEGVGEESILDK